MSNLRCYNAFHCCPNARSPRSTTLRMLRVPCLFRDALPLPLAIPLDLDRSSLSVCYVDFRHLMQVTPLVLIRFNAFLHYRWGGVLHADGRRSESYNPQSPLSTFHSPCFGLSSSSSLQKPPSPTKFFALSFSRSIFSIQKHGHRLEYYSKAVC